jgi:peptidoglycan/LPS O-acetylase OafA/YrhL
MQQASIARSASINLVVFACAASAGIHAGLVPEHLREEPPLGVAFVLVAGVLTAISALVALRPVAHVARIAALMLTGLIAGYIATRTTGIPLLAPDPEAVDPLGGSQS